MNELARWLLNLPPQASSVAREIDALHYFVISVTMLGSGLVFLIGVIFLIRYRRQADVLTPRVIASLRGEVLLVAAILSLFLLIWVVGYRQYRTLQEPPPNAIEVYVTGKQWMWKFAYPEGAASVGALYVPVGRPVKLLLTSRDVIHSFFVPAFRIKQDALPGRYTVAWFEATELGTWPVRCAEYCGVSHSAMLADVVVLSDEDFESWLAQPEGIAAAHSPRAAETDPSFPRTAREGLALTGQHAAAEAGCLRCHTIDGTPHLGPTFTGMFGRVEHLTDGTTVVVDEAYITESMMDPMAKLVAGFAPVMPSYFGRIEPGQVAAIVEYIKTLSSEGPSTSNPVPSTAPVGGSQ